MREDPKIAIMATEWARWRPNRLSLEDIFRKALSYGAHHVELVHGEQWNFTRDDLPSIHELMKKYDVHVACVNSVVALNSPNTTTETKNVQDQLTESIRLAKELDSTLVVVYFGANESRYGETAIVECKKNFSSCLDVAEEEDVIVVVENEFDKKGIELTRTARGAQSLIEGVGSDHFKLNFDIGNFHIAGEESYPYAYEILKDVIAYVHAKDVIKYDPRIHGEDRRKVLMQDVTGDYFCTAIGEGALNWEGFLRRLATDGYDGFLTVEPHTLEGELDHAFKTGVDYISRGIPRK